MLATSLPIVIAKANPNSHRVPYTPSFYKTGLAWIQKKIEKSFSARNVNGNVKGWEKNRVKGVFSTDNQMLYSSISQLISHLTAYKIP